MISLDEYILREASVGAKYYNDEEEHIQVIFYPKLYRAFVEIQGRKHWIEAAGINHALDIIGDDIELQLAMGE